MLFVNIFNSEVVKDEEELDGTPCMTPDACVCGCLKVSGFIWRPHQVVNKIFLLLVHSK